MNKILILVFILLITNSQINTIASAVLSPQIQKNPSNIELASSNTQNTKVSFGSTLQVTKLTQINIKSPKNAPSTLANDNSIQKSPTTSASGSAQWVSSPANFVKCGTPNCQPAFIRYDMTFCIQCLESPLFVYVGVSPNTPFSVYITNTQTSFSYVLSVDSQGYAVVPLDIVQKLGCGCQNVLTIIQWYTTWGYAWTSIQQNSTCNRCTGDTQGLSYFNPKTCRCSCKCLGDGSSCTGTNQLWSGYPKCTCACQQYFACPVNRPNFNYNSCNCDCFKKCQPWKTLDWNNCRCI